MDFSSRILDNFRIRNFLFKRKVVSDFFNISTHTNLQTISKSIGSSTLQDSLTHKLNLVIL